MTDAKVYERYVDDVELANLLSYHYYILGTSSYTDEEYDNLYNKILEYEKKYPLTKLKNSPTNNVGYTDSSGNDLLPHSSKVLSLKNYYNVKSMLTKLNKLKASSFLLEYKIDGISISIIYLHGIFHKAITRGNGIKGRDVTEHIRDLEDVPMSVKDKGIFEVRGELYSNVSTYNDVVSKGENFSSPRNMTIGTINSKDYSLSKKRKLKFAPWQIVDFRFDLVNLKAKLKYLGFSNVASLTHCVDINTSLDKIYADTVADRKNKDFPIDGIVVKVDSKDHAKVLGEGIKYPNWAFALKLPPEEKRSKLLSLEYSMGKTGTITPVAIIKEVVFNDSKVSRVNISNIGKIKTLGLELNDDVIVIKSGDIIPVITQAFRNKESVPVIYPVKCKCGHTLIRTDIDLLCLNSLCTETLVKKILAMEIGLLGEQTAVKLVQSGLVKTVPDLFSLNTTAFKNINVANVDKILNNIQNKRNVTLDKLIAYLGISNLSSSVVRKFINVLGEDFYKKELKPYYDSSSSKVRALKEMKAVNLNKTIIESLIEFKK